MFLRSTVRKKDGKSHEYWSVVENRRVAGGRVVQRQVLYLGEINANQREAWRRTIKLQDEGKRRQVSLFPADSIPAGAVDAIGIRISALRLERPRQWGACWLSCELWNQLDLDAFWRPRLPPSREGTPWLKVLQTLVAYRLIDPGSEWRLHRRTSSPERSLRSLIEKTSMRHCTPFRGATNDHFATTTSESCKGSVFRRSRRMRSKMRHRPEGSRRNSVHGSIRSESTDFRRGRCLRHPDQELNRRCASPMRMPANPLASTSARALVTRLASRYSE